MSTRDAPIGTALTQLLADPESDVLSSFRNCRLELGKVSDGTMLIYNILIQ